MVSLLTQLILLLSSIGLGSAVLIQTRTLKMDGFMIETTEISCLCNNITTKASSIASLQLLGPGNAIIANLRQKRGISVSADESHLTKIKVDGKIDKKALSKSHLTVVLTDMMNTQSGFYTCKLFYRDQDKYMHQEKDSEQLKTGKQDINQVVTYLMSTLHKEIQKKDKALEILNDKVIKLERFVDGEVIKDQDMDRRVTSQKNRLDACVSNQKASDNQVTALKKRFEDVSSKQTKRMNETEERASFMIAFRAGYDPLDKLKTSSTIIFRQRQMEVGNHGYDFDTGIFTAPRDGYYVFDLSVMYFEKNGGKLSISLSTNNDRRVVEARPTDTKDGDQKSVSAVVKLNKGDTVKPVCNTNINVASHNVLFYSPWASYFSGYIIKAL